jgi:hypothetical protein
MPCCLGRNKTGDFGWSHLVVAHALQLVLLLLLALLRLVNLRPQPLQLPAPFPLPPTQRLPLRPQQVQVLRGLGRLARERGGISILKR